MDDKKKEPRVDRRIRVPEVLVIDADGSKLGVMDTQQAIRLAAEQGLNLVEVAPTVRPPVCRILDYGKYKYDLKQDAKRKKRNQVVVEVKEVKFRPKIDKHDYDFKIRHVLRFLGEGDRVKCTIMFRGRELAHTELGEEVLKRIEAQLAGKIVVDQPPRLEGRNMTMLIAPKQGAFPKLAKTSAEAKDGDNGEGEDDVSDHDNDDVEISAEMSGDGVAEVLAAQTGDLDPQIGQHAN